MRNNDKRNPNRVRTETTEPSSRTDPGKSWEGAKVNLSVAREHYLEGVTIPRNQRVRPNNMLRYGNAGDRRESLSIGSSINQKKPGRERKKTSAEVEK